MVKAATTAKKGSVKKKTATAGKKSAAAKKESAALMRYKSVFAGMSIHLSAGSRIMEFLQALPLRIFPRHIFARSVVSREKARLASGALTSGGRHAMSVPCAITSMMRNAVNPTMALNRKQNLRTCRRLCLSCLCNRSKNCVAVRECCQAGVLPAVQMTNCHQLLSFHKKNVGTVSSAGILFFTPTVGAGSG